MTCKECKNFIQEKGHRGRCKVTPFFKNYNGTIQKIQGVPRIKYVSWSTLACKKFERKRENDKC